MLTFSLKSLNFFSWSRAVERSFSMPSIFDVNCVPTCALSLDIMDFSRSSLADFWLRSLFASCDERRE